MVPLLERLQIIVPESRPTSGRSTMCRKCSAKIYSATAYPNNKLKTSLFNGMRQRCYNPNSKSYKNYGGRGIKICDEWLSNPDKFCEWAYANGYKDGMSIERIDVNGNYEPSNCTFIPLAEQSKNRRNVHLITIGDDTMTYSDWCKTFGLDYHNVNKTRNKYNCSPKEALLIHLAKRK